ncbi:MAG: protein kinase domain-containing protein, partial [Myxococcota bacterium]
MKGRPPFRRLMPRYPMECGECGHMLDADDASCDKCGHERPPSGWTALSQPRVRLVAVPNPPSIGEMAGDTTGFQVVDEEAAAVPEPTFHTAPSQPSRPSASSHPSQAGIPLRLRMRALPAADEPTEDLDAFDLLGDERGGAVPARLGQDDGGLAPGKTYAGRYRVEEVLPGGPGADRFAAVQEPLVRRVVLTVLKRGRAADAQEALETRFLREASVLARLRHPNLAPVHDFGRAPDGTCFATEEQLYGLPLQYLADRGKLTTTRVAAVAADVASVLCAMHDAGVLHRAIRSEHVVVAPRTWRDGAGETAQVGRCGLEVTPEDAAALTDAEAALVVPPEVLAGQEPDELADIYAVGVLLYRALAGRPPYEGDAAAVLAARREGDPAPLLRKGDGSLDDRLADVAERCLLAAPDQRFPDARALLGALEALLAAPPEPV